ncbi:MAG: FAD-dependent oxidoreductase [Chloroflexi bacterium]|nr:FAD-dependent oxidoreductase [Chloroflexota bacterium]
MKTEVPFPKLFGKARITDVALKNRLVMLPMGTAYATAIGEVTEKTIAHYVERARGGVGFIITGNCSPFGRISLNQLILDADWYMAGHYELVEAVHAEGTPICLQLNHPGREIYPFVLEGRQPVAPSTVPCSFMGEHDYPLAHPLEKDEIYDIIEKWAEAALRAKKVGYDAMELHGAHGYLIEQFMSPYTNRRTDDFGGSLQNRMRFPLELLKRVKHVVGDGFPIGFRFGAEEFVAGGITIEDSPAMAKMLEEAGVAYLSVTCGIYETAEKMNDTMRDREGWKSYIWEAVKRAVNIPVIAGGGLRTPAFCESVLAEGKADFIGLARPLLADSHWPNKVREGRLEDIIPCLNCGECNHPSSRRRLGGGARRCNVNPVTGRELEFLVLQPASVKKKVLVVGGGPGGMEAARVAALRGHQVTLCDKGADLGGALLLATAPPGKERLEAFRNYMKRQVAEVGVEVRLGTDVTSDLAENEKPDTVIVATGSRPVRPSVPGVKEAITAWDVLSGKVVPRNKKVVVVGGGMVGAETADFLAQFDNQVTVVSRRPAMAYDMEVHNRRSLLNALKEAGVAMFTGKEVVEVTESGVTAVDRVNGEKSFIAGEVVVFALGATPNRDLADALQGKVPELYTIGDCNEPRIMIEAMYEGSRVGRRI